MRKIKKVQADYLTAVSAYLRIKGEKKCLLESIPRDHEKSRYSVIGWNPVKELSYRDGVFKNGEETVTTTDPLKELEKVVLTKDVITEELPFQGGAIGYVGYDIISCYEDIGKLPVDELGIPDLDFYLFDSYLIFDHQKEEILLIEDTAYGKRSEAELTQALESTVQQLNTPVTEEQQRLSELRLDFQSNFTKQGFEAVVERCKEYIREGDLFQVVPSQRLTAKFDVEPFDYYRQLRVSNPSAYMYYLDFGETQIIGSSPESLVSVSDGVVTTNPIAGTRRRGKNKVEDVRLEQELLRDEKERAEHMMLVDLGRNDIGKVSEIGSVEIPLLMTIEKYRYVMHIVSLVTGKLQEGKTAMDALKAVLPAGTVSGAPKIRAMTRIYEFEPVKRGVYAGAVGYFSRNDQADFAIGIRTMVVNKGYAYVQAGAGIVYDSDPESEYFETLQKAKALLEVKR